MDHQLGAAPGGGPHPRCLTAPQQPPQGQLVCPRCNSDDTKFCYYNNYSISQPRYFCKTCRRYWTHGGALRNIPVGGGCRKSKRPRLAEAGQFQLQQQYYQDQLEIVDVKPRVNAAAGAQLQYNSTVMMGANLGFLSSNMGSSSITTIATTLTPSMFCPMNQGHGGGSMSSMTTIQAMTQQKPPSSGGGHSGFALPFFQMQATPRLPSGSTAGNIVLNSGARFLAITSSSHDGGAGGGDDDNTRKNNGSQEGLPASNNHPNQCPKFSGFGMEE